MVGASLAHHPSGERQAVRVLGDRQDVDSARPDRVTLPGDRER
jgi:hypothetical protein